VEDKGEKERGINVNVRFVHKIPSFAPVAYLYFTFASYLAILDACSVASKFAHAVLGNMVRKRWIDARQAAIFYYQPNGAERKRTLGILVHKND